MDAGLPSDNRQRTWECLLDDLAGFRQQGLPVALVTLVRSEGGSPRPLGSQMVVAGNGAYVGHLTGGCAETVIVDEALAALSEGQNRRLRLGTGSPYLDIQLPCGATVELYIDVTVEDATVAALRQALDDREPVALDTLDQGRHEVIRAPAHEPPARGFRRWYHPPRRLLVFGKGPNAHTLARLGQESDYQVELHSPDQATLAAGERAGVTTRALTSPASVVMPPLDAYTAVVLMFHEHDWEPALLRQLLASEVFYLGALGSRRTHQQRCQQLAAEGFDRQLERIRGPVGLDIGAGNPVEIALSILAEMTRDYRGRPGARSLLESGASATVTTD